MEGEHAERDPLTMEECAKVAEECLTKRLSAEFLCMGNINEAGALECVNTINHHFLRRSRPLLPEEIPKLKSLKLPTRKEALQIFGPIEEQQPISLILEEVAHSDSEQNNAVEIILQTASEHELGYKGVSILEMIGHIAYNSAFNQLRTKEQLGKLKGCDDEAFRYPCCN